MQSTINCKGRLIDFAKPRVMGIVNLTDDSFFEKSRISASAESQLVDRVGQMLQEGARFIDIGAVSSRPGADEVPENAELEHVLLGVETILKHFPDTLISVDTFRSKVADRAINGGAAVINDIYAGLFDDQMLPTVAKWQVPYIMMHMRGTPKTMATLTQYHDLVSDILHFFSGRIQAARSFGINDLILDPGFGFAKNIAQNFQLLRCLNAFEIAGLPILAGLSRKSMIYKTLGVSQNEALNGTTFLHAIALQNGANILRVHDVKPAVEAIKLFCALNEI